MRVRIGRRPEEMVRDPPRFVHPVSPYLAPIPHRGKTNEPAYVVHTANLVAELKGVTREALAAATTDNFFRLFSKAGSASSGASGRATA